jgi:hypothetical protein
MVMVEKSKAFSFERTVSAASCSAPRITGTSTCAKRPSVTVCASESVAPKKSLVNRTEFLKMDESTASRPASAAVLAISTLSRV